MGDQIDSTLNHVHALFLRFSLNKGTGGDISLNLDREQSLPSLRPRLHGSGQIFARTKTCTVPPCVYTGPAEQDEFLNG